MPNTKSAMKAMRQNERRRSRNLLVLENIRKATRGVRKAASKSGEAGSRSGKDELNKALASAMSALDKAAKKNIIHRNTASRKKSRLAAMVAKATK